MSPRRVATALLPCLVLVLLAACSGIPTGGPVRQVREDDGLGQSTVRYAPAPPVPGATPQQVVSGFLDAMLAFPPSTAVAEQYLTQEGAERWNPAAGTQVYRDPRVSTVRAVDGTAVSVGLSTRGTLALDARGRVVRSASSGERGFTLRRVDGEWRIADPPPGLMVTDKFYADYYRPFQVFFFDPPGQRLVPTVVHLPAGEQLATALVASLARGPGETRARLRTYLPGLGDLRPAVPVDAGGVAEVDLGDEVAALSPGDQGRLAAQLVHTLRQVGDVAGVRVRAGASVLAPNGDAVQPIDGWGRYGPREVEGGPFIVVDGADDEVRVAQVVDGAARPVPGVWDVAATDTAQIDVGSRRVATLSRAGDLLTVRRTNGDDPVDVAVAGLVAARWLPDDRLLVVDRPGAVRARIVEPDATRSVEVGDLAGLDVTSFAVSPDGARYAVTTAGPDGRVRVGAVLRSTGDTVQGLAPSRALTWDASRPAAVEWVDGARLAFIADTDLGRQVFEGWIDGTGLAGGGMGGTPILPDVDARELVVAGEQRWIVDARDRLWYLAPGSTWTRVGIGAVSSASPGR